MPSTRKLGWFSVVAMRAKSEEEMRKKKSRRFILKD